MTCDREIASENRAGKQSRPDRRGGSHHTGGAWAKAVPPPPQRLLRAIKVEAEPCRGGQRVIYIGENRAAIRLALWRRGLVRHAVNVINDHR